MQRDYYTFRQSKLNNILSDLEQAFDAFKRAKSTGNKYEEKRAKGEWKKAARKAADLEPHLAYLWFSARKEEARQANNKPLERRASEAAKAANAIREAWQEVLPNTIKAVPDAFKFVPDVEDQEKFTYLPPLSFALQIPFQLEKPYISRDDVDFYLFDNPLRKEKIFKVPMVTSTSWKGALRSAMMQQLVADLHKSDDEAAFTQKRLQLFRLFGNEKEGTADYLNSVLALKRVGSPPRDGNGKQQEWRKQFGEKFQKVDEEFDTFLHRQGYHIGDVEGFQGCIYFFPTFFDKIGLEVINPHGRDSGAGSQPTYFECVPQGSRGTFTLIYVPFNSTEQDEVNQRQEVAEDLETLAGGINSMLTIYGFGAKTSSGYGVAEDKLTRSGTLAIRAALPGQPEREPALQEIPPVAQRKFESLSELQAVAQEVADALRKEGEV